MDDELKFLVNCAVKGDDVDVVVAQIQALIDENYATKAFWNETVKKQAAHHKLEVAKARIEEIEWADHQVGEMGIFEDRLKELKETNNG